MLVCEPKNIGVTESAQSDSRSDQELIAALNGGEASAFDGLYYRHRDWVMNLALRFTQKNDLALDVLQETFLYFVKKFPGFNLTCQLSTFLYPVVKNLSLTAVKKIRRTSSLEESLDQGLPEPTMPPDTDVVDEDLAAVLDSLSDDHREVLTLRFVEGFALGEIAEAMGIPLGTVKSRLHHALNTLRKSPRIEKYFGATTRKFPKE